MNLNVNLLLCRQRYAYYDEMAEVRISRFSLYLSYLHIKFDDEINGNHFEFQALFRLNPGLKLN